MVVSVDEHPLRLLPEQPDQNPQLATSKPWRPENPRLAYSPERTTAGLWLPHQIKVTFPLEFGIPFNTEACDQIDHSAF